MACQSSGELKNNCPRCAVMPVHYDTGCTLCELEDLPDALVIEYNLLYPRTRAFNITIPGAYFCKKLRESYGLSVKW